MKSATRVTSKGQAVIPKPVREQADDPIDTLYGCLRDLPRDPLADLEAEHKAEIEVEKAPVLTGDPEILALPATVVRVRRLDRHA